MHLNAAKEHGTKAVWPHGVHVKSIETGDLQKAVSITSLLKEFEVVTSGGRELPFKSGDKVQLTKDAAGISTGTGLGFYDQDSTPGAEYKVKQCPCGGTLVDGICTACRKVVEKVAPSGDLGKDYLTSTFPHALAKRRSAPIDQRLQKSLWDVTTLADQLTRLAKLEGDVAPDAGAVTALRKVFLDLAVEEAAGQIAESTNTGDRERFATASQEVVSITSLLKEFFEVAGFSAKQ
jgi:hypothetical protein